MIRLTYTGKAACGKGRLGPPVGVVAPVLGQGSGLAVDWRSSLLFPQSQGDDGGNLVFVNLFGDKGS